MVSTQERRSASPYFGQPLLGRPSMALLLFDL